MSSRNPVPWAKEDCDLRHETPTRRIGPLRHPTDDEIEEAIRDMDFSAGLPSDPWAPEV